MTETIYDDGKYLAANPTWHIEDSPWKARQILRMMAKHRIVPQTVAEVGCGAGEILRQLSLKLPETSFSGFDPSSAAIELARERENARLHFFQMDIAKSDRTFDVLLAVDVIEHVEDCFGLMRAIRGKARYKIIHFPLDMAALMVLRNRTIHVRKTVGHIHYFSKDTALALLAETGYRVLDFFYTPQYEIAPKDLPHQAMAAVRRAAMQIAPDATAKLFGGCPILVLAE